MRDIMTYIWMPPQVYHVDTLEGVCNGFLALYTFFWFPEFSGYHQWQQESQFGKGICRQYVCVYFIFEEF